MEPQQQNEQAATQRHSYPVPVYLNFVPGGVSYRNDPSHWHSLSNSSATGAFTPRANRKMGTLVQQAKLADDQLRQYSLAYAGQENAKPDHFMPSLSVLAHAAFGRLTGCSPNQAKLWADAMLAPFWDAEDPGMPENEEEIWNKVPDQPHPVSETTAQRLKEMPQLRENGQNRPCGYVFQRGDIAWNCRTCQTDPTCVVCDDCFQKSDHTGHDVYFHRTTPGGCCDCGDAEAWKTEGCCPVHRPNMSKTVDTKDDPMEAVRSARRGLDDAVKALDKLPPRFLAALAVVVGAAVQSIVETVDGAGVGADPVQWKRRWADEATKIVNGAPHNEDYALCENISEGNMSKFLDSLEPKSLPPGYELRLRLHNDDVHTFDEVIDALHEPRAVRRGEERTTSLVPLRDQATEMTHHVDADGQVTVKHYRNLPMAIQGFNKLKRRGLHCAVVSSAQVDAEFRAKALSNWLSDVASAHPAAAALVVHALVQTGSDHVLGGFRVWTGARSIPCWVALGTGNPQQECRRRFDGFPPHLASSYVTSEESESLHSLSMQIHPQEFVRITGTDPHFYASVPYRLMSERYHKSPHALWGTLPGLYSDPIPLHSKHPILLRLATTDQSANLSRVPNTLTEEVFVVDTDLRKQQEADKITSTPYPHRLPGLHLISGVGTCSLDFINSEAPPLPSPMNFRHLLGTSSFRAPLSPILLMLLLDPYPTKQVRSALHSLVLSLLTDTRFKSRFAGALGVAYRPLSTLFCAGVGTEADTPLHFTVQIFTAGSLVRALGNGPAMQKLLGSDDPANSSSPDSSIGIFTSPVAHTIVRCIHTNLLGATKEVNMILNNTTTGNNDMEEDLLSHPANDSLLPALTYVAGEHPLMTTLPAAPDDGFLDSRSTRHKRLPHLLRDLEYVIETPGTSLRLLLPEVFPVYEGPSLSFRGEDVLAFPVGFARMLRLAQGMDPQKRKISGGHVEYEQNRWLEAFGLSLNLAGARDAICESPSRSTTTPDPNQASASRSALGNLAGSFLREIKLWLYREGMLETGLPIPSSHGALDLAQVESLQRSTLHVSGSQSASYHEQKVPSGSGAVALSCATGIKMTETQLSLIENALKAEIAERVHGQGLNGQVPPFADAVAPVMGDWLRVPHAPLSGDSLSFHLPLHRALAQCIRCMCSLPVPETARSSGRWWKLPVLDADSVVEPGADPGAVNIHPLVPVIKSTLRSANCKVVWSSGPDCSPQEAQRRRTRSRAVSANIAVSKVIHSLADHPVRCLAAAQQIEGHLWARNGSSVAGMAMNYSSSPLCRAFRDLDLLLVQVSAAGMSLGLGARRVYSLLLSRYSMEGHLVDPERRTHSGGTSSPTGNMSYGGNTSPWINPPRLLDQDHAVVLAEAFFGTICVLVSELPSPPPQSVADNTPLKRSIRRELVHSLVAEPRTRSEALSAASVAVIRKEDSEGGSGGGGGGLFKDSFSSVLDEIAKPKNQGQQRANSGPPSYELKAEFSHEYDPSFFHLRRNEHQHAMDVVARLRRQKLGEDSDQYCLPVVTPPPTAHPRFLTCRLLLHLSSIDASIRRFLLFALTGGSWLPPGKQESESCNEEAKAETLQEMTGIVSSLPSSPSGGMDVPMTTFSSNVFKAPSGRRGSENDCKVPFTEDVVASSSVSFLEVLQLLTLQVHTLEECAALHRTLPGIDEESRTISYGLSINSYLRRLVKVPDSLTDVWSLQPYPEGPLKSKGSGERRGSILGLLIALFEHRNDQRVAQASDGVDGDDGQGGARSLTSSGSKWLLRFVHALVQGAQSVGAAVNSATSGNRLDADRAGGRPESDALTWTIDDDVRETIRGMLAGLEDLWPKIKETSPAGTSDVAAAKSKEAGKAAQRRMMELMQKKQKSFAATIEPSESGGGNTITNDEAEMCIICRCDDVDGENNGPLGYLGHIQRSRSSQIRACSDVIRDDNGPSIGQTYRVVGHKGCQLRQTDAMDSKALTCLPRGTVVTVLKTKVSTEFDILSRRALVRRTSTDPHTRSDLTVEGWASIQSSQGYVILSPLISLCYNNSRWGATRPVIKQCGHAAHLKCVEAHTLSLHQRAAGDQPYDGRFAANIADGEYLCPLCKQLSNVLIPKDSVEICDQGEQPTRALPPGSIRKVLSMSGVSLSSLATASETRRQAQKDFGDQLYNAMLVPWERSRKKQQQWHPAIQKWDYREDDEDSVGSILRLLRQLLISWAAIGHTAASAEASTRNIEQVLDFGTFAATEDPWKGFSKDKQHSNSYLLELKRTMTGACGLLEFICGELVSVLGDSGEAASEFVFSTCVADIIDGWSWVSALSSKQSSTDLTLWSEVTALTSALPCHAASDGSIPLRSEARATAAAMWVTKGTGTDDRKEDEPPVPLSIQQLFANNGNMPAVPRGWGTLSPRGAPSTDPAGEVPRKPFRPAVASAFLYTPLLAWDLSTLSAGALSMALLNSMKDLPSPEELLHLSKVLMVGRLVQAIVTPSGFDTPDEMQLAEEDCWQPADAAVEGDALKKLLQHCRNMTHSKCLDAKTGLLSYGEKVQFSGQALLAGVGRALLPFNRTLLLLLRACTCAIQDRYRKSGDYEALPSFNALQGVLFDEELMSCEDGFHFLKAVGGPSPSELLDTSKGWFGLINRWLVAVTALELHHGSMGRHIIPNVEGTGGLFTLADDVPSRSESLPAIAHRGSESSCDMDVDNDEEAESDIDEDINHARLNLLDRALIGSHSVLEEDSDQDVDEAEMEDADVVVVFRDQLLGAVSARAEPNDDTGESSEEYNDSGSEEDEEDRDSDRRFAHSSRSPILSYQPSLLGIEEIGPGRYGSLFEFSKASKVMSDLSHLGMKHIRGVPIFSLVRLPKSFVELYNLVSKVKGRDEGATDDDDSGSAETAICLLTGAIMRSGAPRKATYSRSQRPHGACTIHARTVGSGIGIFFLVQKCTVLLMHNNKSAYSPSLYVDEHGEEDPGLRRGRPLYLNESRYRALELQWREQAIPRQVAQIRSTSDRVIRDNWY